MEPDKKKKPIVIEFFRTTVVELKRISWPTRQKTLQLTGIVVAVCIIFGIFVGGLDITFTKLIQLLIDSRK